MLKLKSCPKCKKGDVTFDRDQYGWYEYCIQCGYTRDLENILKVGQQAWDRKERKTRVRTLSKGNWPAIGNRVYILLNIVDGKAEQAAQVLQGKPGVIIVDVLENLPVVMLENPPNVIMMIQAHERRKLAELTIQALASVETMTEHVCLLPARDGLSTNQKK